MSRNVNRSLKGSEMSPDYTFRYKLDSQTRTSSVYHHRLAKLIRVTLESLLDVIVPLKARRDIKIDGFRWLMNKEEVYQLFGGTSDSSAAVASSNKRQGSGTKTDKQSTAFQDPSNAAFYEPRIDLIKKLLESLLALVELEYKGKPVNVDGFRLKDLRDWPATSSGQPAEVFEYTGSHCNCDCIFRCNKGNPPSIAACHSLERTAEEEFKEIRTRIKHFSPEAAKALFPSLGSIYEVTDHPYFMQTLHLLREKTTKPVKITTNGCKLTTTVAAELAELKPVYLYLSLNSSSHSRRRKLMRDPNPEIAINSLPLLKQYHIPYAAVIVPWPLDSFKEMLADLSSTVAYAAENEAHLVQINLPGYSRHFSSSQLFDLHQAWKTVISLVRELKGSYQCPVVTMPSLYEENIYHQHKNLPQIIGVVKNFPAYFSSLESGDVIQQINGIPVHNRPQARELLSLTKQSDVTGIRLVVSRGNQTVQATLNPASYSYPCSENIDAYLGIVFAGSGFRTSYIETLKEIIEAHQAKHVLLLSSELVKPTLEQCLTESRLLKNSEIKIDIEVPQNNFFGGNIFMGDLVVQDFIDHIKNHIMHNRGKPDLVVIPSSPFNLSAWGCDLTGRVYLDIEREAGVPVALLPCSTIYN
ncbi:MAG TPA: hypothetical protein EYP71_00865 [Dehalococcoidia bacterium]|nr:hypothetical protein [Dehalococcoidia bacterium]